MGNIIADFNKFLKSTVREKVFTFKDGFFLQLKKHTKNGKIFLEIHTSGYDDMLEISEAIEWIKWTLFDYKANGIID